MTTRRGVARCVAFVLLNDAYHELSDVGMSAEADEINQLQKRIGNQLQKRIGPQRSDVADRLMSRLMSFRAKSSDLRDKVEAVLSEAECKSPIEGA